MLKKIHTRQRRTLRAKYIFLFVSYNNISIYFIILYNNIIYYTILFLGRAGFEPA